MGTRPPRWTLLCLLTACADGEPGPAAGPDSDPDTDGTLDDTGARPPRPTCHALALPLPEVCAVVGGPFCTVGETLAGAGHHDVSGWEPALSVLMPGVSPHPLGLPLHDARYAGCVVVRTTAGDVGQDAVTFTYDAGGTQVDVASHDWTVRSRRTLDRSCRVARVVEERVPFSWPGTFAFPVPRMEVLRYDTDDRVVASTYGDTADAPDETGAAYAYEDLDADGRVDRIAAVDGRLSGTRWRLRWADGGVARMTERWFFDTGSDTSGMEVAVTSVERDAAGLVVALEDAGGRVALGRDAEGDVVTLVTGETGRRLTWDGDVVVAVAWGSAACVSGPADAVASCASRREWRTYDAAGRLASVRTEAASEGDRDGVEAWTQTFAYTCGP